MHRCSNADERFSVTPAKMTVKKGSGKSFAAAVDEDFYEDWARGGSRGGREGLVEVAVEARIRCGLTCRTCTGDLTMVS